MKKRILSVVSVCIVVCLLVICVKKDNGMISIPEGKVPKAGFLELVEEGDRDINVIPDKYNTGYDETQIVEKISEAGVYGGLNFRLGADKVTLAVDFVYGNSNVEDQIIIQNMDFSNFRVEFRRGTEVASHKEITFENCKFNSVQSEYASGNVSYIFKQCTLTNFVGSNASFESCYFGGSIYDALNPVQDVSLINCYIADLAHVGDRVIHTDGTQIYGKSGIDAQNILYKNCRMEAPNLKKSGSNSGCYVNACLMIQLEYSNANNLLFEDCIINGGGYSIYAWDKNKGYELNDVVFRNIQVGNSHEYGNIYYKSAPTVVYDNIYDADKLYVASVWKDEYDKIHLSVTNDTRKERTLLVVTENGRQEFQIPGCSNSKDLPIDTEFDEMPFDIDIEVEGSNWVVCYDELESAGRQIRFVNWGQESVYRQMSDEVLEMEKNMLSAIEEEGMCGANAEYCLYANGTLEISGDGAMTNFTSSNPAPWRSSDVDVKNIVVEDGITTIGSQAFYKCTQITNVSLPATLENIKGNAFLGCTSLMEISIPESLQKIENRAFDATNISKVYYTGTEEAFQEIKIGTYNDRLTEASIEYIQNEQADDADVKNEETDNIQSGKEPVEGETDIVDSKEVQEENVIDNIQSGEIIEDGMCGKNVSYSLYDDGTLMISGTGAMDNFSSGNAAPWLNNKSSITKVIVGEGVTSIGSQAFYKCTQINEVNFPNTLESIKGNAFLGCTSLTEISIPESLREIGNRAFDATKISTVYYIGTEEAYSKLVIGSYNDKIVNATIQYVQD